jgi:hypothetical protein
MAPFATSNIMAIRTPPLLGFPAPRSSTKTEVHSTVRAPAVSASILFDGDGAGQLTCSEDTALTRHLHQLNALAIELGGQSTAHRLVGKGRAITRQAGSLIEIQHFLSTREVEKK